MGYTQIEQTESSEPFNVTEIQILINPEKKKI